MLYLFVGQSFTAEPLFREQLCSAMQTRKERACCLNTTVRGQGEDCGPALFFLFRFALHFSDASDFLGEPATGSAAVVAGGKSAAF